MATQCHNSICTSSKSSRNCDISDLSLKLGPRYIIPFAFKSTVMPSHILWSWVRDIRAALMAGGIFYKVNVSGCKALLVDNRILTGNSLYCFITYSFFLCASKRRFIPGCSLKLPMEAAKVVSMKANATASVAWVTKLSSAAFAASCTASQNRVIALAT